MNEKGNEGNIRAETVPRRRVYNWAQLPPEEVNFRAVRIPFHRQRGFVYFLTDGHVIKIGFSRAPTMRKRDIRSISGDHSLTLIAFFPGYMDEEHNLHRLFEKHCLRGEWFCDCQDIRDLIATFEKYRHELYSTWITINDILWDRHEAKLKHINEGT